MAVEYVKIPIELSNIGKESAKELVKALDTLVSNIVNQYSSNLIATASATKINASSITKSIYAPAQVSQNVYIALQKALATLQVPSTVQQPSQVPMETFRKLIYPGRGLTATQAFVASIGGDIQSLAHNKYAITVPNLLVGNDVNKDISIQRLIENQIKYFNAVYKHQAEHAVSMYKEAGLIKTAQKESGLMKYRKQDSDIAVSDTDNVLVEKNRRGGYDYRYAEGEFRILREGKKGVSGSTLKALDASSSGSGSGDGGKSKSLGGKGRRKRKPKKKSSSFSILTIIATLYTLYRLTLKIYDTLKNFYELSRQHASAVYNQAIKGLAYGVAPQTIMAGERGSEVLGLNKDTYTKVLATLTEKFRNIGNLDKAALEKLALILNDKGKISYITAFANNQIAVDELADILTKDILDRIKQGKDIYGRQVGKQEAFTSIYKALSEISPEWAALLERLYIDDENLLDPRRRGSAESGWLSYYLSDNANRGSPFINNRIDNANFSMIEKDIQELTTFFKYFKQEFLGKFIGVFRWFLDALKNILLHTPFLPEYAKEEIRMQNRKENARVKAELERALPLYQTDFTTALTKVTETPFYVNRILGRPIQTEVTGNDRKTVQDMITKEIDTQLKEGQVRTPDFILRMYNYDFSKPINDSGNQQIVEQAASLWSSLVARRSAAQKVEEVIKKFDKDDVKKGNALVRFDFTELADDVNELMKKYDYKKRYVKTGPASTVIGSRTYGTSSARIVTDFDLAKDDKGRNIELSGRTYFVEQGERASIQTLIPQIVSRALEESLSKFKDRAASARVTVADGTFTIRLIDEKGNVIGNATASYQEFLGLTGNKDFGTFDVNLKTGATNMLTPSTTPTKPATGNKP